MENLKINIWLKSPLLISRFSTIDSILVNLYINKYHNGWIEDKSRLLNFDFLEKSKDGYNGSIWFVEKDEDVLIQRSTIAKRPDYDYLNSLNEKPKKYTVGSGEFKAYKITYRVQNIKKIYFYARGRKETIDELLKDLKFIGKKTSIGFGEVEKIETEIIDNDKSVFLDKNTPSRPISLKNYKINNNRIAYYNAKVPYWDKTTLEACYMPNSSLIETLYIKKENTKLADERYLKNYVSAVDFTYNLLHNDTTNWETHDVHKDIADKDKIKFDKNKDKFLCVISNTYKSDGVLLKKINTLLKSNFTDYAFLSSSKFISKEGYWVLKNGSLSRQKKLSLGFHILDENGITFVMGNKRTKTISDGINEAKLPFSLVLKTTPNNQHTVFKSTITLSKELISCQYGDETFYFDFDEAKNCLIEADNLVKNKGFKRSHLIPNPQMDSPFIKLNASMDNKENNKILSNFFKKYNEDVRAGAFLLTIGEKD